MDCFKVQNIKMLDQRWNPALITIISVKKINKKNTKGSYINFKKNKTKTKKIIMFFSSDTHSVSQSIGLYGK